MYFYDVIIKLFKERLQLVENATRKNRNSEVTLNNFNCKQPERIVVSYV